MPEKHLLGRFIPIQELVEVAVQFIHVDALAAAAAQDQVARARLFQLLLQRFAHFGIKALRGIVVGAVFPKRADRLVAGDHAALPVDEQSQQFPRFGAFEGNRYIIDEQVEMSEGAGKYALSQLLLKKARSIDGIVQILCRIGFQDIGAAVGPYCCQYIVVGIGVCDVEQFDLGKKGAHILPHRNAFFTQSLDIQHDELHFLPQQEFTGFLPLVENADDFQVGELPGCC